MLSCAHTRYKQDESWSIHIPHAPWSRSCVILWNAIIKHRREVGFTDGHVFAIAREPRLKALLWDSWAAGTLLELAVSCTLWYRKCVSVHVTLENRVQGHAYTSYILPFAFNTECLLLCEENITIYGNSICVMRRVPGLFRIWWLSSVHDLSLLSVCF